MQESEDPITACKLYEKKSRNGNTYFTGRLGGLKVLIFKTREVAQDGSPIWDLKLAQAQPYEKRERPDDQAPRPAREIEPIDDGIDLANEGPAPYAQQELTERAERGRRGGFDDSDVPL